MKSKYEIFLTIKKNLHKKVSRYIMSKTLIFHKMSINKIDKN